jgi:hypothetical protein
MDGITLLLRFYDRRTGGLMIIGEFDKAVCFTEKKTQFQRRNGSVDLLVVVGFALGGWVVALRMGYVSVGMCVCVCVCVLPFVW